MALVAITVHLTPDLLAWVEEFAQKRNLSRNEAIRLGIKLLQANKATSMRHTLYCWVCKRCQGHFWTDRKEKPAYCPDCGQDQQEISPANADVWKATTAWQPPEE